LNGQKDTAIGEQDLAVLFWQTFRRRNSY